MPAPHDRRLWEPRRYRRARPRAPADVVADDALPALEPLTLAFADEAHHAPVGQDLGAPRGGERRPRREELPRLERVRTTADLPAATAAPAETLVEPNDRVDERDPEEKLEAHVGERPREAVVGANADLVLSELVGDGDVVSVDGNNCRSNSLFEVREVPAIYDLHVKSGESACTKLY